MHFITPIAFTLTNIQRTFGENRSLHGRFEEQGGMFWDSGAQRVLDSDLLSLEAQCLFNDEKM